MKTFMEAQEVLSANLPGYETRAEQMALASRIEATLAENEAFIAEQADAPTHLFGQAGTGSGKAFGYLIPAILSGHRTIVSVTTKALQSQLEFSDLPFLQQHLGVSFSWAILKGRSNYVCTNRMSDADESEIPALPALMREATAPGFGGERGDFTTEITDKHWALIRSEADDCKDCGGEDAVGICYAHRARTHAQQATIVVVNHSLLASSLLIEAETEGNYSMLGEYDVLAIDEAHEFADVTSGVIGGKFSQGSVRHLTHLIQSWASRFCAGGDSEFVGPIGNLIAASEDFFDAMPSTNDSTPVRITVEHIESAIEQMSHFYQCLSRLGAMVKTAEISKGVDYTVAKRRRDSLSTQANNIHKRFLDIVSADFTDIVRWVEYETRKDHTGRSIRVKAISVAPISVAPFLSEHLFAKHPVIMVSATLAVKGSFDFAAAQLGVEKGTYTGVDVGTPFDYPTQARIYLPTMPDPSKEGPAWESSVAEEVVSLAKASGGRTLVLFTSVAHMRRTHQLLVRRLSGMTVKMQGQETVSELSQWFSTSPSRGEQSVLLGVKSFFTGFDIRGEALTNVVIAKMPFPVPTEPLFAARSEKVEANGGNSFRDLTLPVMSLVFQQAAGRLIRSKADRGVITILDPRVTTKGYGRQIISDLPPAPVVRSIVEATAFLDEVADHFGIKVESASQGVSLSL